jgi:predicted nucleic acid-binding protein
MHLVVDASVGVKWCLPAELEEFAVQAVELLDSYRREEMELLVPDLFWIELSDALGKAARRMEISADDAMSGLSLVRDLGLATVPSIDLVPQALRFAVSQGRTVYESLYVALAMQSKSEMITADERLANALAARFPVKWLGAF